MINRLLPWSAAVLLAGSLSPAASPQLAKILPRGGQRGAEVQLTFIGDRLADAREILIYQPGVTISRIEQPEKGQVGRQLKVTAKIAPDARLGEYGMRIRTAGGISEFRTFWVSPFPTVLSEKATRDFHHPQAIPLNVTVEGVIDSERVDYFVVEGKKGQRLTAEIEGMRLGNAMFDPYVAILDENRFELSASDDTTLHKQDSIASILAPRDGRYIIQVRDSAFGGSPESHYRLHVGTFPRPRIVFPLGGQVGQKLNVQFLGDVAGPIPSEIVLPDKPDEHFELFCRDDGGIAPSPNEFRVSDFPSITETEPNDSFKTATAYAGPLPVAFNGILNSHPASQSGDKTSADADHWKFNAKKGQVLEIHVFARQLRSPLDSVLSIHDSTGRQLALNDDSGGPDSYLRFNVPADGSYFLRIRDHLRGAGPLHAYRIEITPVHPSAALSIPQYTQQYSQERQAVTVPRGNRYATLVRLTRQDVGGTMALIIPDLPAGVEIHAPSFDPGVDTIPVLFEAKADAPMAGGLVETHVKPADPKSAAATSRFQQVVELVHGPPNQTPYYETTVDRMALAVAEEAPFTVQVIEPKVPLVQGGQMSLKVIAHRKKDFTGPIALHFLFRPPGIEAASTIEIPAGQSEALYPINASDGAPVRKWQVLVLASAEAGGPVWVSSPFINLEVATPLVTGKIATASVEQGKAITLSADLDVKTKWEGKAKVELIGLPGGASAEPREISAEDKKAQFAVTTQKSTPAAAHNGLFLRVTVNRDGEPIVHNIARGGVLRVDLPPGAKKTAPEKNPQTPAKAKDSK